MYYNKYADVNLEPSGIYLTEHDAFALPKVVSGVFTKDGGGGRRLYAKPKSKTIKLTLKIDNARLSTPDYGLYKAVELFAGTTPAPLVLEERPDRYIDCIPIGSISTSDSPGFTTLPVELLAPIPFFKSFDTFDMTDPPVIVMEGNAPHYPVFTITGPAENPILIIDNDWGISSKSYSGSLGVSDVLVIDTASDHVTLNGGGVDGLVSGPPIICAPGINQLELSAGTLRVTGCWWYY